MNLRLYLTFGFLAVCIGLLIIAQRPLSTAHKVTYDAYFLWAGVTPQVALEKAKTIYILSGEVRREDNSKLLNLKAGVPNIAHADIWMTVRVETIDWRDQVFDRIISDLRRWEEAGNRLQGLQIDFDAATFHLDKYSNFLVMLRKRLPERFGLSVTGVMDWLVLGEADVLENLGEVVDEVVIQTYQDRDTIEGYEFYLGSLSKLKFPYRIGIVQNGEWQEPVGLKHDPNFLGYVVFLLNPINI